MARFTADGGRVLRADSSQSETDLAFSGLHQLLRPVRWRIDALPPRQRGALHVAFGMTERSEAPGPMLIRTAVLTMLSDLAAERPLLVVVDDAQWADRASLDALSFVARRLADEPVTLLVATRDSTLLGLAHQEPTLTLEPLDRRAAERLLDFQPRVPAGPTRASILDQAGGNPRLGGTGPGRRRPRLHVPHGPRPASGHRTAGADLRRPSGRTARRDAPRAGAPGHRRQRRPAAHRAVLASRHRRSGVGARRGGRTRPAKRGTIALRPPALPPRDLPHGPRRGAACGASGAGRAVRRPGSRPARLAPCRRYLRAERGGLGPARRQREPSTSPQWLRGCRPHAGTGRGPAPRPGREHPAACRRDQCGGPDRRLDSVERLAASTRAAPTT